MFEKVVNKKLSIILLDYYLFVALIVMLAFGILVECVFFLSFLALLAMECEVIELSRIK